MNVKRDVDMNISKWERSRCFVCGKIQQNKFPKSLSEDTTEPPHVSKSNRLFAIN